MTNYERIKNMSIEEMAKWLDEMLFGKIQDIYKCGYYENDSESQYQLCVKDRKSWLESEVEE
jgi:hypothetical protein|nr:MAG TPA: hypothetical protein [Caudoviricetes sp.]